MVRTKEQERVWGQESGERREGMKMETPGARCANNEGARRDLVFTVILSEALQGR